MPPVYKASGLRKSVWRTLPATLVLLGIPQRGAAHDFGMGGDAYATFLSGGSAVLTELPIMIALIATGIMVSLWKRDGLPKVWLAILGGVIIGMILATVTLVDPVMLAYGSAMILGLLAAAAIKPATNLMRLIAFLAGLLPVTALLSGHEFGTVPIAAYAGILALMNVVLAASATLVAITLEKLPYGWVPIAFRAAASWMVAIALMSFAFLLRSSG